VEISRYIPACIVRTFDRICLCFGIKTRHYRKMTAMRLLVTNFMLSFHDLEVTNGREIDEKWLSDEQIEMKKLVNRHGYKVKLISRRQI